MTVPDLSALWLPSLSALLVGMSKGGLPTVGMLAVPVLALQMSPLQAASVLLPIFILTDAISVYLYRRHYSAFNVRLIIPWALLGVLLGWGTASYLSERLVGLMVGVIGIAFCINAWLGKRRLDAPPYLAPRPVGALCSTVSGFTSFVSHAGGPPYHIFILPQRLDKMVYVGTTAIIFSVINWAKVLPYHQLRPYSTDDLLQALWLVPCGLVGTLIGAWMTRHLEGAWFYRLVQAGLFLVSLKLILDYVMRGG